MTLPTFRYHPDPRARGSIIVSDVECRRCGQRRGYAYTGPVYSEADLDEALCPWCIAAGSAHREFGASFVDGKAFGLDVPESVVAEISERTPGYRTWQRQEWPACCNDATGFVEPAGAAEIRKNYRELEGSVLSHIVYNMRVSGGAATRLFESLNRETGPTVYLFRCLGCAEYQFHIDRP